MYRRAIAVAAITASLSLATASPGFADHGPAMPTDVAAEAANATTILVTWSDNSGDESSFEINNGEKSQTVPDDIDYVKWTVTPGTYMCFKVRAVHGAGASEWSPNTSPYYACTTTPGLQVPDLRTIGNLLETGKLTLQMHQCLTGRNPQCIEVVLELLGITLPESQAELVRNLLRANLVAVCGVGIIAALPTGGPSVLACGPLALDAFIEALTPRIVEAPN